MSLERKMNNKQLLDALDHVDDRFVAELVTSIKPPETAEGGTMQKKNIIRSIKYAALLAACAVLMGAAIPLASSLIGRISLGTGTQSGDPAGIVGEGTSALEETELPATESLETEPAPTPGKLMAEYGWSPKEITEEEADKIIADYLKKDSDPNKFDHTYSVTCYAKYGNKPVYAVMINSDRWTYEPNERVEKIFYRPENPNLHIDFIFPSDQPLWIYAEGEFYTLNEAMQQSVLSFTQLMNIRWSDRKGGGFSSFVYPLWLSHDELVEIVHSNPESYNGGWKFRCYGSFNGVYAVIADKKFMEYEPKTTVEIVGTYTFVYPNENKIQICAHGNFYSLSDAYKSSIITDENLAEIYKIYTMSSKIKEEFYALYGDKFADVPGKYERISIMFQGIFDDVYVASIASDCCSIVRSPTETVNGITFTWMQQYDLNVYCDGKFYTLTEAFENGLLNNEQLLEVHEKYNTAFNEMFGDR